MAIRTDVGAQRGSPTNGPGPIRDSNRESGSTIVIAGLPSARLYCQARCRPSADRTNRASGSGRWSSTTRAFVRSDPQVDRPVDAVCQRAEPRLPGANRLAGFDALGLAVEALSVVSGDGTVAGRSTSGRVGGVRGRLPTATATAAIVIASIAIVSTHNRRRSAASDGHARARPTVARRPPEVASSAIEAASRVVRRPPRSLAAVPRDPARRGRSCSAQS